MPEILPLTNDVLPFHIKQAAVWQQCHLQHPQLPLPETMGWRLEDSVFVSVLKSLHSCPDACADLIFHACIHNVQELVANAECLVYHAQ